MMLSESNIDAASCPQEEGITKLEEKVQNLPYSFPRLSLQGKTSVSKDEDNLYVFHVVARESEDPLVAASLSSGTINIYSLEELKLEHTLKGNASTVAGIKFSQNNPFILYSAYKNGTISLWDLREHTGQPSQSMKDEEARPATSFDIDQSENFICTGTELINEDAFLLFWDCRSSKLLGGYWDCHMDDITHVCFHPHKKDLLASASVDGLINVYDTSLTTEEDAIQCTLNADVSLEKVKWLCSDKDAVSSVSHIGDVHMWNLDEAKPLWSFSKGDIMESVQNTVTVDYVVDTFQYENDVCFITGSNNGLCHAWRYENCSLKLCSQLESGHKDVVRSLFSLHKLHKMITGGEDGNLCVWKMCDSEDASSSNYKIASPIKQGLKSHQKIKPY